MKVNTNNYKKLWTFLTVLILLSLFFCGYTLAYMVRQTDEVVNQISYADPNLEARLTEPDWDGIIDYDYENGTPDPVYEPGYPVPGKEYGKDLADHVLPGISINKNPMITNLTKSIDEWVAMKLTFVYGSGHLREGQPLSQADYMRLIDIINIDYNDTDWELIEENGPYLTFYYRSPLASAGQNPERESTEPVFTTVSIRHDASNYDMDIIEEMCGFVIYMEGFAAQVQKGDDYETFSNWGRDGGVVFHHTPSQDHPVTIGGNGIFGK